MGVGLPEDPNPDPDFALMTAAEVAAILGLLTPHGGSSARRRRVSRIVLSRKLIFWRRGEVVAWLERRERRPSSTSSWRTHSRTAASVRSRSRATSGIDLPVSRISSTVCALNSGEK